jgi:hypothetical protein
MMTVLLAGAWATTARADVDCSQFKNNTIRQTVNDNVVADGYTCIISVKGFVNGNLTQTGFGSVVIYGGINGNVYESGTGHISVVGGLVEGDLNESDVGNLMVRDGADVNGTLTETGPGRVDVVVSEGAVVKGDIFEYGAGQVYVTTESGSYEGTVFEEDIGNVILLVGEGTVFKGNAEENGNGSLIAEVNGLLEGNLVERGFGILETSGAGKLKGNTEYERPGGCSNSLAEFEGTPCVLIN